MAADAPLDPSVLSPEIAPPQPPPPVTSTSPRHARGGEKSRPKRAYRLRQPFRMTRARRVASRANAAQARAAQQARGWPRSDLQRAAACANLVKARQATQARNAPRTEFQRAASRASLVKALEALRARGWPHSQWQRARARASLQKAQAANRKRGRLTPRQWAALRLNIAKASARLREMGYVRTRRRLAACRANLRKAWEVSHDLANYARIHGPTLKHGLCAPLYDEMLLAYAELLYPSGAVSPPHGKGRAKKKGRSVKGKV